MSVDDLWDMVEGSHIGIIMFTDRYKDDPKALLELGAIIALDKPMYLIVQRGALLPEKIRAIADGVFFYDGPDEMNKAAHAVMKAAKERGHLA